MLNQKKRFGKFTSSQIYRLMKKGRAGTPSVSVQTYIDDVILENRLGRVLNSDSSSRSTVWGAFLEAYAFAHLGFGYDLKSDETIQHPDHQYWAGTPDVLTAGSVGDIKCPFTMKSFAELAQICIDKDLVKLKENKQEYYWQLVSNSILTKKDKAEIIVFCPFKKQLDEIRALTEAVDEGQTEIAWIFYSDDEKLPYLPDECKYFTNLHSFEFTVPKEDILALTNAVASASEQVRLALEVKV